MTYKVTIHDDLLPDGVDAGDVLMAITIESAASLEEAADYAVLKAENDALVDAAILAYYAMLQFGNAVNWPLSTPTEYTEAINALRAALRMKGEGEQ